MSLKLYTQEEVALHNKDGDTWLIIGDKVFDVSKFMALHPAGKNIILKQAGKDVTDLFKYFHDISVYDKYEKLIIGKVEKPENEAPPLRQFKNSFGDGIPFGDPNYMQGWVSPFYNESHHKLREALRTFFDQEVKLHYEKWDEEGQIPMDVIKKFANNGILALCIGAPWPTKWYPSKTVCGVKLENLDTFHELVFYDEINRFGSAGIQWGITAGTAIGLPPIIKFGSQQLQDRIVGPCINGEKLICLAITGPNAGSDVANIEISAKKTADGQFYVVNGLKKWITNAIFCDYYTTAVRTGGKGMGGLSLLLIEKTFKGVTTKKMKCQGMWSSGTTSIVFEDVHVPVANLIGKEGEGFKYIMINFNHERLFLCMQATRMARVCVEESMKFAHKRKTFGKRLIDHPVIRNKLAHMTRQVEGTFALLEQVCYNYDKMGADQKLKQLSGTIAILKAQATITLEFCAKEAVQIFGGLGYTRGGQGGKIERIYREVRGMAIPGGSEDIMLDLGARQASKLMPKY